MTDLPKRLNITSSLLASAMAGVLAERGAAQDNALEAANEILTAPKNEHDVKLIRECASCLLTFIANAGTFDTFSSRNRARSEAADGFNHKIEAWSASDWITALVGELGEAANVIKKLNRSRDGIAGNKQTDDELRAKLKRELGDTGIYLDLICQAHGFTIGEAMKLSFNEKSDELGFPYKV